MSDPEKWVSAGKSVFKWPTAKTESSQIREGRVRADLTRRLNRICENLTAAEFTVLIAKMTREQLRSEGLSQFGIPPVQGSI